MERYVSRPKTCIKRQVRPHVDLPTARKLQGLASENGCTDTENCSQNVKIGHKTSLGTETAGPCPEQWSSTLKHGPLNGKLDTKWQLLSVGGKLKENTSKKEDHDTNKERENGPTKRAKKQGRGTNKNLFAGIMHD